MVSKKWIFYKALYGLYGMEPKEEKIQRQDGDIYPILLSQIPNYKTPFYKNLYDIVSEDQEHTDINDFHGLITFIKSLVSFAAYVYAGNVSRDLMEELKKQIEELEKLKPGLVENIQDEKDKKILNILNMQSKILTSMVVLFENEVQKSDAIIDYVVATNKHVFAVLQVGLEDWDNKLKKKLQDIALDIEVMQDKLVNYVVKRATGGMPSDPDYYSLSNRIDDLEREMRRRMDVLEQWLKIDIERAQHTADLAYNNSVNNRR